MVLYPLLCCSLRHTNQSIIISVISHKGKPEVLMYSMFAASCRIIWGSQITPTAHEQNHEFPFDCSLGGANCCDLRHRLLTNWCQLFSVVCIVLVTDQAPHICCRLSCRPCLNELTFKIDHCEEICHLVLRNQHRSSRRWTPVAADLQRWTESRGSPTTKLQWRSVVTISFYDCGSERAGTFLTVLGCIFFQSIFQVGMCWSAWMCGCEPRTLLWAKQVAQADPRGKKIRE
jgi:hypothetical protein